MVVLSQPRLLTHGRVVDTYRRVSAPPGRTLGVTEVSGITSKHTLIAKRLEKWSGEVRNMLAELPDGFHAPRHSGWGISQMIIDRHGTMWTDSLLVIEMLCVLGIGTGLARWCEPDRSKWAETGGFPYFVVQLPGLVS